MLKLWQRIKEAEPAFKSILFLYFCLLFTGLYSHFIRLDYPYKDRREALHQTVIEKRSVAPVQYRILPALISENLKQFFQIPIMWGYWGQRLFFSFLAVIALHYYLRKWFSTQWTVLGVVSLLAVLPYTYIHYGFQPIDPIVFACYVVGLILIEEKRESWLLLLLLIGMTAKETVSFLAVIYFFTRFEPRWDNKFLVYCLLYALAILAVYFGIRWYYGPRPRYVPLFTWRQNLTDIHTYTIIPIMFSAYLLGLFYLKQVPDFLKRALLVVPIFILVHFMVGLMKEARLFVPLAPLVIPVGLFYIQDHWV